MTAQPFTAELTLEQVEQGERINQGYDPIRRMGLSILTRDHDDLLQALRDGGPEIGEAYLEVAESLGKYHDRLLGTAELIQSAQMRLWMVMQAEIDRLESHP